VNWSAILLLETSLLIIVSGFAWIMLIRYSQRLSRIDEELREITVLLSEMPKENSIKDYMFAQDQRLCDIREKLDTYSSTNELQQYIQDQANQIIAIISTHDETRNEVITKADLELSLQITNELLEKVLWSLRFDENKFVEDAEAKRVNPEEQDTKKPKLDKKCVNVSKEKDDHIAMTHLLDESNDSYDAILKYMQQSGKSGADALQALEAAKVMRNR
jgi:hypothetical protein